MSRDEIFKIEKEGAIAWLTLNRPEKRNTMTIEFFDELPPIMNGFDEDPEVRVVVIKAEGKSFTAGLDLMAAQELLGDGSARWREWLQWKVLRMQEGMNSIERCRKPVIAALHGHCIGGGIDLCCACDIRYASKDALFSIRETRIGIIADMGTLQRVPYIIGHGWFRELALTGRDFSAEEALKMGFVTRVCDDREALYAAVRDLAEELAALPPLTVQGVKDVINYSRDNGVYPGLAYVAQKNSAAIPNEDMMEAITAMWEKRKPMFKGN
ncbi:MAG: crotonase/enoyl-CoA hydratase family protein [Syntrophales bacterium]|jgi:enoyl-CoA hydratase|nr:crotonase/enoyl-CoA hydratase family protein [Syntrophales bacterium]MCK9527935.1 crotonase/enoyl-CoA hydratase family protein [Syntrophales bacterium]MDX9921889.1 crotonase/enoyl-CoA hydratase family protein [Syntrophales bacterium]